MIQAITEDDDFDRDADADLHSEERVVNITDEVVRFEIGTQPGSKPRRYRLAAYGRADSGVSIQAGYAHEYKGVGRGMIPATIETLTEREVYPQGPIGAVGLDGVARPIYPAGPRLPRVVREDKAEEARAAWKAGLQAGADARHIAGLPPLASARAEATPLERPARVREQPIAAAVAAPVAVDVDDDDVDEIPGPGADLPDLPEVPEPVFASAPKAGKGKGR